MKIWATCWSSTGGPRKPWWCCKRPPVSIPTLEGAHFNLGKALAMLGKGKEADEAFEKSFDLNPERKKLAHAAEHQKAGRLDEAERLYDEVLRANPANVDALRMMGTLALGRIPVRRRGTVSAHEPFPTRLILSAPSSTRGARSKSRIVSKQRSLFPARHRDGTRQCPGPLPAGQHSFSGSANL